MECSPGPTGTEYQFSNCYLMNLIDDIPVSIHVPMATTSPVVEYVGNKSIARLRASYKVRCYEDFYGPQCLTKCVGFHSCSGCGLSGYTGEFCQCKGADCIYPRH